MQVINGDFPVYIIIIISYAGSDTDLSDLNVLALPGQAVDHCIVSFAGIWKIRNIQNAFCDGAVKGGGIEAAAGVFQPVVGPVPFIDDLIPAAF